MIPSVVVNLLIIAHDLKISTNTATVLSMPKAATVYIPGSFKYICLVIVDVVESSFPPMESYYIGHSYKATNSRNTDFSKLAHKMLGRNTDKPAVTISMTDCFAACQLCATASLSRKTVSHRNTIVSVIHKQIRRFFGLDEPSQTQEARDP